MRNKRQESGGLTPTSKNTRQIGTYQRCALAASAELNEQIGLVLWRLQGTLSRQERREAYQRLEVLLSRKYAGGMQ